MKNKNLLQIFTGSSRYFRTLFLTWRSDTHHRGIRRVPENIILVTTIGELYKKFRENIIFSFVVYAGALVGDEICYFS